jgi:hypothetical protein
VSIRYTERLADAGIEPSVGSRGDSYDSALAETINGLYKAELIHRRAPWKTREAVELATLEWVSWFNHHRLLEPIGYIPPVEAEANYWREQGQAAAARGAQEASAGPCGELKEMKSKLPKRQTDLRSDSHHPASTKVGVIHAGSRQGVATVRQTHIEAGNVSHRAARKKTCGHLATDQPRHRRRPPACREGFWGSKGCRPIPHGLLRSGA